MICNSNQLTDALERYRNYKPTAANGLEAARAVWIPVIVHSWTDRQAVIDCAEAVLDGKDLASTAWATLSPSHRLDAEAGRCEAQGPFVLVSPGAEDPLDRRFGGLSRAPRGRRQSRLQVAGPRHHHQRSVALRREA